MPNCKTVFFSIYASDNRVFLDGFFHDTAREAFEWHHRVIQAVSLTYDATTGIVSEAHILNKPEHTPDGN